MVDIFENVDVENIYENYLEYQMVEEDNNAVVRAPRRIVRDATNPFEYYSNEEFRKRYRFRKDTVLEIIHLIGEDLNKETNRGLPIPVMMKVLLALRFFATGIFQMVAGDLLPLSQSSACRIINHVAVLLSQLRPRFIKFPEGQAIRRNAFKFRTKFGFPGVMGCIDCTHVRITNRGGNIGELYRNRHGVFSFNVQCVSGPNLEILDIVAGWPGSTHDARIFDNSRVRVRMESGDVPHGYVLLGDRGYACRSYLLTPLANPTTAAENRYQTTHIKTRNSVERTFGVWKKKFHCLSSGLAYKTRNILAIIVATAVLYNIGKLRRDNDIEEEEDRIDPYREDEPDYIVNETNIGMAVRRAFIQRHFSRN